MWRTRKKYEKKERRGEGRGEREERITITKEGGGRIRSLNNTCAKHQLSQF